MAVGRAQLLAGVARGRLGLATTFNEDAIGLDAALFDQICLDRLGAALRQGLVVAGRSDAIGVAHGNDGLQIHALQLLQQGIQRMGSTLRDLISGIRDGVTQIASAAEELSAVTEQTSAGANSQKVETDQVATAMHEMAATDIHEDNDEKWEKAKFSNADGSHCTAVGKYKIGNPYMGRFGLAYKLYGLDSTNSNAFKRYVVLHAHDCVPNDEVFTEICQSDGCPTVSPNFLKKLQRLIDDSPKPVLLWIYE